LRDYLRRFWFVIGIPALGVGLVFGAAEIDEPWAWYLLAAVLPASALIAVIPNATRWTAIVRNNPDQLTRISELEEENTRLKGQVEALEKREARQFRAGLKEGLKRAKAAALSSKVETLPQLVNKSVDNGIVTLYGESPNASQIEVGTRFRLEVPRTGQLLGIVEVVLVVEETSMIHLICVEPTVPDYWDHLAQQASDPSAPPSVALVKYELSDEDLDRGDERELQ